MPEKKQISIWLLQPKIIALFLDPTFLSNILPTIPRVIHHYQWLFSYILHQLSILLPKAESFERFGIFFLDIVTDVS